MMIEPKRDSDPAPTRTQAGKNCCLVAFCTNTTEVPDMQVKDVMTKACEYISPDATLMEAAQKMAQMDIGFLPIGSEAKDKLEGVITDRDIVIRAIAKGL